MQRIGLLGEQLGKWHIMQFCMRTRICSCTEMKWSEAKGFVEPASGLSVCLAPLLEDTLYLASVLNLAVLCCAIPSTEVVFTHPYEEDVFTLHLPLQHAVLMFCCKDRERSFSKVPLEAELAVDLALWARTFIQGTQNLFLGCKLCLCNLLVITSSCFTVSCPRKIQRIEVFHHLISLNKLGLLAWLINASVYCVVWDDIFWRWCQFKNVEIITL